MARRYQSLRAIILPSARHHHPSKLHRIPQRMTPRRIIKNHPRLHTISARNNPLGQPTQKLIRILRPIPPRRTMQPKVTQPRPSTRLTRQRRTRSGISHSTRHLELPQQPLRSLRKPRCVTRLDHHQTRINLPQHREKLPHNNLIKRQLRRKLHQHGPKLLPQRHKLGEKCCQRSSAMTQLRLMGHSLRSLHRKPKVIRHRIRPPRKCLLLMRTVKR